MANSTARMLLKTGKSFPNLLHTRLVGQPNINICNKQQLIVQSLINPTQKTYERKPILRDDGFNVVDFVPGKDHELRTERWKSSTVKARGPRLVSDEDEDEEIKDEEDRPDYDDFGEFSDDTPCSDDEDDDAYDDDDGDDHGVSIR